LTLTRSEPNSYVAHYLSISRPDWLQFRDTSDYLSFLSENVFFWITWYPVLFHITRNSCHLAW